MHSLSHLLELLALEKKADLEQYSEKFLKTSLQERKKQGLSWYPVAIRETGYTYGERVFVEIERTTQKGEAHSFQSGMPVAFFCNAVSATEDRLNGTIQYVKNDTLKIVFNADELPDWASDGKLGIDLLFDETTYEVMEKAVKNTINAQNNRLAQLRDIFVDEKKPAFNDLNFEIHLPNLNTSQNEAVKKALMAQDVAIIHGPPGTGKTTTLVEAIGLVLKTEKQVMVCSSSNLAVDWLAEKLIAKSINVVRIGNPVRVSENLQNNTVDAKIALHQNFSQIKKLRKQANEYRNIGNKYKRNFGAAEREQRKLILAEAKNCSNEANNLEDFIVEQVLEQAQVIACTFVGSMNRNIIKRRYSTVFIDEAAQALEPACWIVIEKAQKVVFAGDHCQLPPTIKSMEAAKKGLSVTLFEKIIHKHPDTATLLETQYRMNENIMNFSNQEFYENKLKAHESVATQTLKLPENPYLALEFIDTAGTGYEESLDKETLSTKNEQEGLLLVRHLENTMEHLKNNSQTATIGVITPYKAQAKLLAELLQVYPSVSVGTVDGFQGQERDIIYISLVRSNENNDIGFLADTRRMNVALTRAKRKLVVIGDSATIGSNGFYKRFLDYTEKIGAYKSAWEYIS